MKEHCNDHFVLNGLKRYCSHQKHIEMLTVYRIYISLLCCRFINFSTSQFLSWQEREGVDVCLMSSIVSRCVLSLSMGLFVLSFIIVSFQPIYFSVLRILLRWCVQLCRKKLQMHRIHLDTFSFGSIVISLNPHKPYGWKNESSKWSLLYEISL